MRLFLQFLKSSLILISMLLFWVHVTHAQTSVKTGISVGFNRHTFSIENSVGSLKPGVALAGTYGIPVTITQKKWELHTGFFANDLSQAFYFQAPNSGTYGRREFTNGISSFKIPLKIGRLIRWTSVTTLSPQIGFSWLTNRRTDMTGTGSGSYGSAIAYEFKTYGVNKNKFLAEAGLDVNISLLRSLDLELGAHYALGLQTMEKIDITYQINSETYSGTVVSKGTGWKFNVGLKIPLYRD